MDSDHKSTGGSERAANARADATDRNDATSRSENEAKRGAGTGDEKLEDVGREAAAKASERAQSVTERVREGTREQVRRGQKEAADRIGGVAEALGSASERFREQDLGFVAEGGERLASQVHDAQRYLEEKDPEDLLDDLRGFARRNPAVFLGGMFVAGLALARFATADDGRSRRGGGAS